MPHPCVALKCVLELCIGRVSDLDSRVRIPPVCVESATNRVVCVTEPCVPTSGVFGQVRYLGVQRQDGNGEWCPLSVT